jgi:hypothetical protein
MAIFRGVGGSGDSSDNSFLQEVTAQANAASASAFSAATSASSILNLTAATGAAGTDASYDASTGVLTIPRGDAGVDAVVDTSSVSSAGAVMDSDFSTNGFMKRTGSGSYTVDTNTYLTSHQDISGKANLTGANFTGGVSVNGGNLSIGTLVANQNVNVFGDITVSGTVDGVDIATRDSVLTSTTTTADNALPKAGGQMTGNITFSGTQTVDGRDLSVDGSKLDNLLYSRTSDAQLTFFVNTALSTLPTTKGRCFSLATPFDCVRFVDVEFEITYNSSTSTNDIIVTLGLVVPSGTHTVHNLGTATQITDSAYSNGYADRWFSVDGDKSHLFSHFCGVADSSTPSSPTYVNAWVYRADLDKTYFNAGIFGTNGISNGDTVYLHPFDWENSGTVIQEDYNMDSTTAYGLQREIKTFRVKTAYDDSRLEYRVLAREEGSSDTATIEDINVIMTDYEV